MLALALLIVPYVFAYFVIYGAMSDLASFRIPNWVSYGLFVLFVVQSFLTWLNTPYMPSLGFTWPPFSINFAIGFTVLVVAMVFWARGYIGGGDAKYLAATSLFMGPLGVVEFMVLLSAFALGLALALKLSSTWGFLVHAGKLPAFVKRLYAKFEENKLPYGFPIGLAAMVMIPQIFST